MFYALNILVYAGKHPESSFCVSNKPSEIEKRMAKPLFESGVNITVDNDWFTDERKEAVLYQKCEKIWQLLQQFLVVKEKQQCSCTFSVVMEIL